MTSISNHINISDMRRSISTGDPKSGAGPSERVPRGQHCVDAFDGAKLRHGRKQRAWSQGQLAEQLHRVQISGTNEPLSHSRIGSLTVQISLYESGKHKPRVGTVHELAQALGIQASDLLAEGAPQSLATLRARRSLTQEGVAGQLSISRSLYGHVERGRATLDLAKAAQLARLLQIPDAEMIEMIGPPRPARMASAAALGA